MLKYLLVLVVVAVVVWMLTARARPPRPRRGNPAGGDGAQPTTAKSGRKPGGAQQMLRCAHCGVHLPSGEALLQGPDAFCSAAHRQRGPAAEGD